MAKTEPIGDNILSQDLIISDVPLLASENIDQLLFWGNGGAFDTFLLGDFTTAKGKLGVQVTDVDFDQKISPTYRWVKITGMM